MDQQQTQPAPVASAPPPTNALQPPPPPANSGPPPPAQAGAAPPPPSGPPPPAAPAKDERDKVDKALEDAQQKYGGKYFKDPKKNRAMNEKITDFLRKFFEKKTG
ncbi:Wiskott-Aldrich syndrome protein 1, partial [Sticta canariensis]|nr:Wiskott-Aldrich syndrome protein 1 [Sticta canariensis]